MIENVWEVRKVTLFFNIKTLKSAMIAREHMQPLLKHTLHRKLNKVKNK